MVVKPGKHQRGKQRCQDLRWKVHDGVQSFVFSSYTMHELRNQHGFYWPVLKFGVKNYCVLCTVKAQKGNKNLQQRTIVGFHNHSPLLTMVGRINIFTKIFTNRFVAFRKFVASIVWSFYRVSTFVRNWQTFWSFLLKVFTTVSLIFNT